MVQVKFIIKFKFIYVIRKISVLFKINRIFRLFLRSIISFYLFIYFFDSIISFAIYNDEKFWARKKI